MVELRKRKTPPQAYTTGKKKKTQQPVTTKLPENSRTKESFGQPDSIYPVISVGETLALDGFGGEVEFNDGSKTTLKSLVDASNSGVVIFTYPRASTPGCKLSISPPSPIISVYLAALLIRTLAYRISFTVI